MCDGYDGGMRHPLLVLSIASFAGILAACGKALDAVPAEKPVTSSGDAALPAPARPAEPAVPDTPSGPITHRMPAPVSPPESTMTATVGKPAPAFRLKDHTGQERALADFRGKRVVLWFYPKANTGG